MLGINSACGCLKRNCLDYNDKGLSITEYLNRIKQGVIVRNEITEHEETCLIFNGECNQFFIRGTIK